MDGVLEFLKQLVNPESIIHYGGIYLLLFVVFAETGLFVGFFLPGDSLLFTAGLLCSTGIIDMHPSLLVILIIIAAVAGNLVGYGFEKRSARYCSNGNQVFYSGRITLLLPMNFIRNMGRKQLF